MADLLILGYSPYPNVEVLMASAECRGEIYWEGELDQWSGSFALGG